MDELSVAYIGERNGWLRRRTDAYSDEKIDRQTRDADGYLFERTNGWMDIWINSQIEGRIYG